MTGQLWVQAVGLELRRRLLRLLLRHLMGTST